MKNQTITTAPLHFMPYAQARVIRYLNNDSLPVERLRSYDTIVAEVIGGWLRVYGLYSRTTRRHISAFLKEVATGITFQTAKACYTDGYQLNIYTGEVIPL